MMISAFTIIKNAIKFDYPIVESVDSLLPFVDEYIINIGKSDDRTRELLKKKFGQEPKVKMFDSNWEDSSQGTKFFSSQTNLALERCSGDWVFYLQADECIHELNGPKLKDWAERAEAENAQGVTFKYFHFEKNFHLLRPTYTDGGDSYDKEIRFFKNDGRLVSFGDGQSFAFTEDLMDARGPQPALHRPERFVDSPMHIYHYGYVKDPKRLLEKKKHLSDFYNVSEPSRQEKIEENDGKYVYREKLTTFLGSHPAVMTKRINEFNKKYPELL